jgi:LAO/AO transport system kinase
VSRRVEEIEPLLTRARAGELPAIARLITFVEGESPALRAIAVALAPFTGRAMVVGLTGAPGVGKSTSTSALVGALRAREQRVAVLAIDPSSPFSGGALLGDRIRMGEHATDPGVFIRSMATRGHLGGLSAAIPQAVRILDAVGYDVIVVETVGVGQAEIDIAQLADTTLVLLAPGLGDSIQAAKAGILEIADILIVNKADLPGADRVVRDLRQMRGHAGTVTGWQPPIVKTVAAQHDGVEEVLRAIDDHRLWLVDSGAMVTRRRGRAAAEIAALALAAMRSRFGSTDSELLATLSNAVAHGDLDPYSAADQLLHDDLAL